MKPIFYSILKLASYSLSSSITLLNAINLSVGLLFSFQTDTSERKSLLACWSFFLFLSLVWVPLASDMVFGCQNPGLSRNGARSRTKGSLKIISMPRLLHLWDLKQTNLNQPQQYQCYSHPNSFRTLWLPSLPICLIEKYNLRQREAETRRSQKELYKLKFLSMSNNNNKKSPFMFQGFQNSKMRIPGKKKKRE